MLYKPNYCCNCGEKIERVDWTLLTSRRFCEPCADEKRGLEVFGRAVIVAGILGVVFGFGSLWGGVFGSETGPSVQPEPLKNAAGIQDRPSINKKADPSDGVIVSAKPSATPSVVEASPAPSSLRDEQKYFCGALTKKGTPCSRRVKAKGLRCFQHEGRPEAPRVN